MIHAFVFIFCSLISMQTACRKSGLSRKEKLLLAVYLLFSSFVIFAAGVNMFSIPALSILTAAAWYILYFRNDTQDFGAAQRQYGLAAALSCSLCAVFLCLSIQTEKLTGQTVTFIFTACLALICPGLCSLLKLFCENINAKENRRTVFLCFFVLLCLSLIPLLEHVLVFPFGLLSILCGTVLIVTAYKIMALSLKRDRMLETEKIRLLKQREKKAIEELEAVHAGLHALDNKILVWSLEAEKQTALQTGRHLQEILKEVRRLQTESESQAFSFISLLNGIRKQMPELQTAFAVSTAEDFTVVNEDVFVLTSLLLDKSAKNCVKKGVPVHCRIASADDRVFLEVTDCYHDPDTQILIERLLSSCSGTMQRENGILYVNVSAGFSSNRFDDEKRFQISQKAYHKRYLLPAAVSAGIVLSMIMRNALLPAHFFAAPALVLLPGAFISLILFFK